VRAALSRANHYRTLGEIQANVSHSPAKAAYYFGKPSGLLDAARC
jgi:hypothetical protein